MSCRRKFVAWRKELVISKYKKDNLHEFYKKSDLEYIIVKAFGANTRILTRERLKSSKLSCVEIVNLSGLKNKDSCVVKVLSHVWKNEPINHKIAKSVGTSFIPDIYFIDSINSKTVYLQERIRTRQGLKKEDVVFIANKLINFYRKSIENRDLIPDSNWSKPLYLKTKTNIIGIAKKMDFYLGSGMNMPFEEIYKCIEEVILKTEKYKMNFIIHDDLHVDQFLLAHDNDIKLSDWGFLKRGNPLADIASLLRTEPDGRNDEILNFRDLFIKEFNIKSQGLGVNITDENMCLWRKRQCIRDILWFEERYNKGVELGDPLHDWCFESALEFKYLCISKSCKSWQDGKEQWLK